KVAGNAAVRHPLGHVTTTGREISPFVYVDPAASWPAVDSHPKLQARMFLKRATDLHRTLCGRFRSGVKNQRHSIAGRNFKQTARGLGTLKLFGRANNPV